MRYKHAGQVLANMAAMGSDKFASERLPGATGTYTQLHVRLRVRV
jgi:hypothetical protein